MADSGSCYPPIRLSRKGLSGTNTSLFDCRIISGTNADIWRRKLVAGFPSLQKYQYFKIFVEAKRDGGRPNRRGGRGTQATRGRGRGFQAPAAEPPGKTDISAEPDKELGGNLTLEIYDWG